LWSLKSGETLFQELQVEFHADAVIGVSFELHRYLAARYFVGQNYVIGGGGFLRHGYQPSMAANRQTERRVTRLFAIRTAIIASSDIIVT
jgi:hypothetical protein